MLCKPQCTPLKESYVWVGHSGKFGLCHSNNIWCIIFVGHFGPILGNVYTASDPVSEKKKEFAMLDNSLPGMMIQVLPLHQCVPRCLKYWSVKASKIQNSQCVKTTLFWGPIRKLNRFKCAQPQALRHKVWFVICKARGGFYFHKYLSLKPL